MDKAAWERIFVTRKQIVDLISTLTIEQINTIPEGFKNNVGWNFGHIIATQQRLCYKNCDLPYTIPEAFIDKYSKGTAPTEDISQEELNEILRFSETSLAQLQSDYESGLFKTYNAYQTSFGVMLSDIDRAIGFIPVHEGLHLGVCMSIKKLV